MQAELPDRFFPAFPKHPSDEYLDGWRRHIDETGYPETYDLVSNTRPEQMTDIVLLSDDITVPIGKREHGAKVPCPFCSKGSPKFAHGRMAYFPDEKAVRFIGPRCAEVHFGENYANADRLFKRQQACREYVALWQHVAEARAEILQFFNPIKVVAEDLQHVRTSLDDQAPGFCAFLQRELSQHRGLLRVRVDLGMRDKNGTAVLQDEYLDDGKVAAGMRFLGEDFATKPIIARFETALEETAAPLPEWSPTTPEHPNTVEVLRRGKFVEKAFGRLVDMYESLQDGQAFLKPDKLRLLNQWGNTKLSSPFAKFEAKRDERQLFIRAESLVGAHYANVLIPKTVMTELPGTAAVAAMKALAA